MSLLIVGTVAFDSVETPFGSVERVIGGSGTFSSFAASFFSPSMLVGVVGEDFPQDHLELLGSRGVDTRGVTRAEGKTFFWAGRYEKDVNVRTTLATELNVLSQFDPMLPADFKSAKYLFLANIAPELQLKVLDQCEGLKFSIMDTMNYWIESDRATLDKVLSRVDAVLLNDEEARMLTGETVLQHAARRVLEMGPKFVFLKKGEHGVMLFTKEFFFALPGFPLDQVKDPTGAGDSFAGGLVGCIAAKDSLDEETLRQAVVAGSVTASFCCEDFSVDRFKCLSKDEVKDRAKGFLEATAFKPLEFSW